MSGTFRCYGNGFPAEGKGQAAEVRLLSVAAALGRTEHNPADCHESGALSFRDVTVCITVNVGVTPGFTVFLFDITERM